MAQFWNASRRSIDPLPSFSKAVRRATVAGLAWHAGIAFFAGDAVDNAVAAGFIGLAIAAAAVTATYISVVTLLGGGHDAVATDIFDTDFAIRDARADFAVDGCTGRVLFEIGALVELAGRGAQKLGLVRADVDTAGACAANHRAVTACNGWRSEARTEHNDAKRNDGYAKAPLHGQHRSKVKH